MTLLQLLQSLPSYKPAFRDTYKSGTRKIKCWEQLSPADYKKLQSALRNNRYLISLNNNFTWNNVYMHKTPVFVIKLTKAPSRIKI